MNLPTTSSVRDLTKLFEPDIVSRSESVQSLECHRQLSLKNTPGDEHNDESVKTEPSNSSSGESVRTDPSMSSTPSKIESKSETDPSSSQSTNQSPYPGDSDDDSTCQLQALQRSPSISPPLPLRPLGHMGANLQMFLTYSEFTEAGIGRKREGMTHIIYSIFHNLYF